MLYLMLYVSLSSLTHSTTNAKSEGGFAGEEGGGAKIKKKRLCRILIPLSGKHVGPSLG